MKLKFQVKFNKIYDSNEDQEFRKFNFLNSLKAIEQNRQQYLNGDVLHQLAVNHLSDLVSFQMKICFDNKFRGEIRKSNVLTSPKF